MKTTLFTLLIAMPLAHAADSVTKDIAAERRAPFAAARQRDEKCGDEVFYSKQNLLSNKEAKITELNEKLRALVKAEQPELKKLRDETTAKLKELTKKIESSEKLTKESYEEANAPSNRAMAVYANLLSGKYHEQFLKIADEAKSLGFNLKLENNKVDFSFPIVPDEGGKSQIYHKSFSGADVFDKSEVVWTDGDPAYVDVSTGGGKKPTDLWLNEYLMLRLNDCKESSSVASMIAHNELLGKLDKGLQAERQAVVSYLQSNPLPMPAIPGQTGGNGNDQAGR